MLARISVRTLIVKEWKETFWLVNNGKLLLYRSKEDYLYVRVAVFCLSCALTAVHVVGRWHCSSLPLLHVPAHIHRTPWA